MQNFTITINKTTDFRYLLTITSRMKLVANRPKTNALHPRNSACGGVKAVVYLLCVRVMFMFLTGCGKNGAARCNKQDEIVAPNRDQGEWKSGCEQSHYFRRLASGLDSRLLLQIIRGHPLREHHTRI